HEDLPRRHLLPGRDGYGHDDSRQWRGETATGCGTRILAIAWIVQEEVEMLGAEPDMHMSGIDTIVGSQQHRAAPSADLIGGERDIRQLEWRRGVDTGSHRSALHAFHLDFVAPLVAQERESHCGWQIGREAVR